MPGNTPRATIPSISVRKIRKTFRGKADVGGFGPRQRRGGGVKGSGDQADSEYMGSSANHVSCSSACLGCGGSPGVLDTSDFYSIQTSTPRSS